MDEDAKTLLAILALVYGSSNGIGLFKTALDDVQERRTKLETSIANNTAAPVYLKKLWWSLFRGLWKLDVIVYCLMVLMPPLFLAVVVLYGPAQALELLGLHTAAAVAPVQKPTFYWILLGVAVLSSTQLVSPYLSAWRLFITSWRKT
jgi:hypothetical protein